MLVPLLNVDVVLLQLQLKCLNLLRLSLDCLTKFLVLLCQLQDLALEGNFHLLLDPQALPELFLHVEVLLPVGLILLTQLLHLVLLLGEHILLLMEKFHELRLLV